MRTLITSDWHLGLFWEPRDRRRLEFIRTAVQSADQVILNGDIWDNWWVTWNEFKKSGWSELFPLLKSKNTIYITGNHDGKTPKLARTFWDEAMSGTYKLTDTPNPVTVMHGHELDSWKHADSVIEWKIARWLYPIGMRYQEHALARGATSGMWKFYGKWNDEQKKRVAQIREDGETFIVGHTHLAEDHRDGGYINAGMVDTKLNRASYVVVDNGQIELVRHYAIGPEGR